MKIDVRGGENESARAKTAMKFPSPLHSFFAGHGTNEESSVHILIENIRFGVIKISEAQSRSTAAYLEGHVRIIGSHHIPDQFHSNGVNDTRNK